MDLNSNGTPEITITEPKKQKLVKWHECGVDNCTYRTNKKSNLTRHVKETHNREKVVCDCGKVCSQSGLSRHKRGCSNISNRQLIESEDNSVPDASHQTPIFIELQNIAAVQHVITMKDGSVVRIPGQVEHVPLIFAKGIRFESKFA